MKRSLVLVSSVACACLAHGLRADVGDAVDASVFGQATDVQVAGARGGAAIANVPVAVRLAAPDIDYAAFAADGSDLRVVDAAGRLLAHEVETWNPSGESLVWVNIPELGTGGATIRLLHQPTAGAELPTVRASDVWSARYAGVWHLNDTDAAAVRDATGKLGNGSVPFPDATKLGAVGALGSAVLISTDTVKAGKNGGVKLPTPQVSGNRFTLSAWFRRNPDAEATMYYDHLFFNKTASSGNGGGFAVEVDNGGPGVRFFGGSGSPWSNDAYLDATRFRDWTHLTIVYDGAPTVDGATVSNAYFYVNGAFRGKCTTSAATFNPNQPFVIGNDSDFDKGGSDVSFKGWMDEVRVMEGVESAEEVATRYAAMAEPGFARVLKTLDAAAFRWRTPVHVGLTKGDAVANVPARVRLSAADGFSYDTCAADGSDIRFADAAGHALAYERETWDPAGESSFWVMLPTLPAAGTTVYMYHGLQEGASAPAVDCSRMWQAGYRGVWHFDDPAAVRDASGQIADGEIRQPEVTTLGHAGKFGASVSISASTEKTDKNGGVYIPDFPHGGRVTVSGWFKHLAQDFYYDHMFLNKNKTGDAEGGFAVEMDYNDANVRICGYGGSPRADLGYWKSGTFTDWAHVAYVLDGTNATMYVNGESHGTRPIMPVRDGERPFVVGNGNTADIAWKGWVDEVRVSYGGETACDIAAKYAAMADPSFVRLGDREVLGAGHEIYSLNVGYDARAYGRFAPEDYAVEAGMPQRLFSRITPVNGSYGEHAVSQFDVAGTGAYAKRLAWTFPGLVPRKTYQVRLYFIDGTYSERGKRVVDVLVNGTAVLQNVDYYDACGFASVGVFKTLGEVVVSGEAAADGTLAIEVAATVDNAQVHAVEIVDPTGDGTPVKPLLKSVTRLESGTHLSIGSQTGLTTYEVRRRRAGGAYETVATGRPHDFVLLGEADAGWSYSVRGVADGKAGPWSDDVAVVDVDAPAAAESWIGVYVPKATSATWTDPKTGRTWRGFANYPAASVTWSDASTADGSWLDAPREVLAAGLGYGSFQICVTNLLPAAHYTLRLYTGETYHGDVAKRQSYLLLNGTVWEHLPQENGLDYFAHFGRYRLGMLEYETVADHLGRVFLRGFAIKDNAQFAAFELLRATRGADAGAWLTARNAQTDGKEREILATAVDALAFDWSAGAPEGADEDGNEIVLSGIVDVPFADTYTFTIEQNGNGFLYVDDVPLAAVWGSGAKTASASRELCAGPHTVRYRVNQAGGPAKGAVLWQAASGSIARQVVGAPRLSRPPKPILPANDGHEAWRLRHVATYRQGADVYPVGTAPDNGSTRYRMVSTGVDWWGANEHYPFFSRKVKGDGSLTVRLLRMQGMQANYTSFGLDFRTTDGSANMDWAWNLASFMEINSTGPDVKMSLRTRGDADAANGRSIGNIKQLASADQKEDGTLVGINLPLWLRLTRTGTKVTTAWSRNGEDWKDISTETVAACEELYVGVMALANQTGTPEYEFDSLKSTFRSGGETVIFVR